MLLLQFLLVPIFMFVSCCQCILKCFSNLRKYSRQITGTAAAATADDGTAVAALGDDGAAAATADNGSAAAALGDDGSDTGAVVSTAVNTDAGSDTGEDADRREGKWQIFGTYGDLIPIFPNVNV